VTAVIAATATAKIALDNTMIHGRIDSPSIFRDPASPIDLPLSRRLSIIVVGLSEIIVILLKIPIRPSEPWPNCRATRRSD
jgi:hypothetical protein